MDKTEIQKFCDIAANTVKVAGERLKLILERRVNTDAGNDVKLQEDVESEMFIRDILKSTNIPVIGEEQGGAAELVDSNSLYWVVDPIDGTYNYLRGIPGVCVSVGLMKGWLPVAGAIYDFTRNELYSGGKGLPLRINGVETKPNWAKDIKQAVLMTGFPNATDYSDDNLKRFVLSAQKFKKVRMCGSACCAISWVAAGRADCYCEDRLYLWDIAAGLSLIESAGGVSEVIPLGIADKPFCISIKAAANKEYFI